MTLEEKYNNSLEFIKELARLESTVEELQILALLKEKSHISYMALLALDARDLLKKIGED